MAMIFGSFPQLILSWRDTLPELRKYKVTAIVCFSCFLFFSVIAHATMKISMHLFSMYEHIFF